jgi:hypothetical protein
MIGRRMLLKSFLMGNLGFLGVKTVSKFQSLNGEVFKNKKKKSKNS